MEEKVVKTMSELDDLHRENKMDVSVTDIDIKVEDDMTDYISSKIVDWQAGQSLGLGAREKGACVAYLFDRLNKLTEEVEALKNGK